MTIAKRENDSRYIDVPTPYYWMEVERQVNLHGAKSKEYKDWYKKNKKIIKKKQRQYYEKIKETKQKKAWLKRNVGKNENEYEYKKRGKYDLKEYVAFNNAKRIIDKKTAIMKQLKITSELFYELLENGTSHKGWCIDEA